MLVGKMRTIKKALLAIAMLAGAAALSSANAADIYSRGSLKDAPVEYMPAITWTGFYIGAAFIGFDDKSCGDGLGAGLGVEHKGSATPIHWTTMWHSGRCGRG